MSMSINFEPHSWYMNFAIRKWDGDGFKPHFNAEGYSWEAYTDDGNTYRIDKLQADTLDGLKQRIREYHLQRRNGYGERIAAKRLEYLRGELEAERISYGEIAELEELAAYIADDDIQLLQWAGVLEGERVHG